MELRNALSTSSEASLLSKHITYSIAAASQGSVILPPIPEKPNSACDMSRSSLKTVVPRYTRVALKPPAISRVHDAVALASH